MYGGLSGYNVRVDGIKHVKTSRTDLALYVIFSIRRCMGVKVFAITLFLTNYVLAAAMVWVAICAHFGRPLPESALFLPLTNILLLPQLRAAMPGVPDFGIFMDLFGYYVNIVAIVFSAMFMFFKIIGNKAKLHASGNDRSDEEIGMLSGTSESSDSHTVELTKKLSDSTNAVGLRAFHESQKVPRSEIATIEHIEDMSAV